MSKQREVRVGVKTPEAALAEATQVWKRAEKGHAPRKPIEGVYFADFVTMARILTPRRIELLLALQARGKTTVRALAQRLKRDYKNVHGDVQRLKHAGLIETENGYVHVPWKTIRFETVLTAKSARRAA
ncbi:MAG: MarR family transcriptional regulator [Gammaproteobacteria bacterium]|nr:MarR family transcriptional regulator [Gammaproteobacteria bacterium]